VIASGGRGRINGQLLGAVTAIVTLIFTGGLFLATYKLYTATNALVTGADRAAARQLRAYVYLEVSAGLYPPPPAQPNRFAVSLSIVNSGKSWARKLQIRHAVVIDPTGDPFDPVRLNQTQTNPMVLGPGQRIDTQLAEILLTDLPLIARGEKRIFYVAWVTYEDALTDPPVIRQTQLSQRLNADLEGIGHVSFTWMPTHNCVDDDCQ
jgi:hypothetical protein